MVNPRTRRVRGETVANLRAMVQSVVSDIIADVPKYSAGEDCRCHVPIPEE